MPMPMPQQPVNPQYMPAQRSMPHPNDAVLRRSRKPTDKNIPDGVEDVVIGEGVQQYKSLRDLEKRLDAAIVRKRLDIQDSISKTVKKYRTMRIWISNTVENQPWQNDAGQDGSMAGSSTTPGSGQYKVKIEGRLLDDDEPSGYEDEEGEGEEGNTKKEGDDDEMEQDEKKSNSKRPRQRFSHFFKTITIDFDKTSSVNLDEMSTITWNKPQQPPNAGSPPPGMEFDCLQFSRASQENLNVTISLVRDETPERYKLSKELADVLDTEEETRSGIVLGIWDYIRAMGLQEDEEKRQVRCDDGLRAVCSPYLLSKDTGNTNKATDIPPRCYVLPPDPRECRPAHSTHGPHQTPLHHPRRPRPPRRPPSPSDANRLRHPSRRRRPAPRQDALAHPEPAVHGRYAADCIHGRPGRADRAGADALARQARLLHIAGQGPGELLAALAQFAASGSGDDSGRGDARWRRGWERAGVSARW